MTAQILAPILLGIAIGCAMTITIVSQVDLVSCDPGKKSCEQFVTMSESVPCELVAHRLNSRRVQDTETFYVCAD